MPRVLFTQNLRQHLDTPECEVDGTTVIAALQQVFAKHPRLKSYVLDDQGEVRRHMVILVDGIPIRDRAHLSDALARDSEVFVFQALSGG